MAATNCSDPPPQGQLQGPYFSWVFYETEKYPLGLPAFRVGPFGPPLVQGCSSKVLSAWQLIAKLALEEADP